MKIQKRIIAVGLMISTILIIAPIGASAEWKQDSTGWWYTEVDSWATGWRLIDGKWYYFNSEGYMMHDTTIDGYSIGSDGAWIQSTQNSSSNSDVDEKTADDYVKSLGYNITNNQGKISTFTLDKNKFYDGDYQDEWADIWSYQKVKPSDYFGKQITIYGFKVKNHPLEKKFKIETNVYIMISEGKVIGGYSIPDNGYTGGAFSLDGKN